MTNREKELTVNIVLKPSINAEDMQFEFFDEDTEDMVHAIIKSCAYYCGLKFLDVTGEALGVIKSIIYNPEDLAMKYILELVDGLMHNGPDYSDLFIEEFFAYITDINHVFEYAEEV